MSRPILSKSLQSLYHAPMETLQKPGTGRILSISIIFLEVLLLVGLILSLLLIWSALPGWGEARAETVPLSRCWPFMLFGFPLFPLWLLTRKTGGNILFRMERFIGIEKALSLLDRISPLFGTILSGVCLVLIPVLGGLAPERGLRYEARNLDRPLEILASGVSPSGDLNPRLIRTRMMGVQRVGIHWRGWLRVSQVEGMSLSLLSDGECRVFVGGEQVLSTTIPWEPRLYSGEKPIPPGKHEIVVEYSDEVGHSVTALLMESKQGPIPIPAGLLQPRSYGLVRLSLASVLGVLKWGFGILAFLLLSRLLFPLLDRMHRRFRLCLAVIVLLAAAFRIAIVFATDAMTLSDEAVIGIMARNISDGRDFPLMYYGQDYNGALLAWLQAPLHRMLNDPFLPGKILSVLFSVMVVLAGALLVRGEERNKERESAALLTALLLAFPPVNALILSLTSLVGPSEVVFVGMLLFLLIPRYLRNDVSWVKLFFVGVLAGLALWDNFQVVYFFVPLAVLALARFRGAIRLAFGFGTGMILGMFPLILYNLKSWPPPTFLEFQASGAPPPLDVFWKNLVGEVLPGLFGLRGRWDRNRDLYPAILGFVSFAIHGCSWLALFLSKRPREEQTRSDGERLVILLFPIGVYLFSTSRFGFYGPRHAYSMQLLLPVLFGFLLARMVHRLPRESCLFFLFVLTANLWGFFQSEPRMYFQPVHYLDQGMLLPERNSNLIARLKEAKIRSVNADYWIANPLMLESKLEIFADSDRDRYLPPKRAFQEDPAPGYVFHINEPGANLTRGFLRDFGYSLLKEPPFVMALPPGESIPRARWSPNTPTSPETAHLAIDGDLTPPSAWHAPPDRDNWFEIWFEYPIEISKVGLFEGEDTRRDFSNEITRHLLLEAVVTPEERPNLGRMTVNSEMHSHLSHFEKLTVVGIRFINEAAALEVPWSIRDVFVYPGTRPITIND